MPKLDAAIEKLYRQSATHLVMETGALPVLQTPTGPVPLLNQQLTTEQIGFLVAQVAPEAMRADLAWDGHRSFPYTSPSGRVTISLEREGAWLTVSIRPDAAASQVLPPGAAPRASAGAFHSVEKPFHSVGKPVLRKVVEPSPPPPTTPAPHQAPAPPVLSAKREFPDDPLAAMELLLSMMVERKASDLHLAADTRPTFRLDGDIQPDDSFLPLTGARLKEMLWSIAPERNRREWEATRDTDFAHETPQARFRVNVLAGRKGIGAVLRQIPSRILSAEDLGLSPQLLELCDLSKGLVLVTGPTGSGKSTTLAAMIDHINRNRSDHIITIEDPIEFVHPDKRCIVTQREVGVHTDGFKKALRAALREDPDVVLVGELRDLETISIAIETAETGHLVFGTLHTNTAPSTVDRIIDQFPADRQAQVRTMLSESLKGVIAQTLVKKIGGGRVAALEVLLGTPAISNLIREGKTFQFPSLMQTGKTHGMTMLNDSLFDLVKRGLVDPKDALAKAVAKAEFKQMLERASIKLEAEARPAA